MVCVAVVVAAAAFEQRGTPGLEHEVEIDHIQFKTTLHKNITRGYVLIVQQECTFLPTYPTL